MATVGLAAIFGVFVAAGAAACACGCAGGVAGCGVPAFGVVMVSVLGDVCYLLPYFFGQLTCISTLPENTDLSSSEPAWEVLPVIEPSETSTSQIKPPARNVVAHRIRAAFQLLRLSRPLIVQ